MKLTIIPKDNTLPFLALAVGKPFVDKWGRLCVKFDVSENKPNTLLLSSKECVAEKPDNPCIPVTIQEVIYSHDK